MVIEISYYTSPLTSLAKMSALIIVDLQKDFFPGGSLTVAGSDEIVPLINNLRDTLDVSAVFLTKDWHPADHCSFADNHCIKRNDSDELSACMLDKVVLPTGEEQILWPRHCVKGSSGAEFHDDLNVKINDRIVIKGLRADTDCYSAFGSSPRPHGSRVEVTTLDGLLYSCGIKEVFIGGLAFDHCVKATAIDAVKLGYKTTIIREATRAMSAETATSAEAEMIAAGVIIR